MLMDIMSDDVAVVFVKLIDDWGTGCNCPQ